MPKVPPPSADRARPPRGWRVGLGWVAVCLALALAVPMTALAASYSVGFAELEDDELADIVRDASRLRALADQEPPGPAGLIRRAEADRDRIVAALRSLGYYDGTVEVRFGELPLGTPRLADEVAAMPEPVAITVAVTPASRYRVNELDIVDARDGSFELPVAVDRDALGLAPGDPARADRILQAETRLRDQMRRAGHPYAEVPVRQVMVDRATGSVDIAFAIEPGPPATMGEVTIVGLEQVDPAFVQGRVPYRPGEPYTPRRVEELRADLFSTQLFSSIRVVPAETLGPDGRLPVRVEVEEGPRRFGGLAASYATSEGVAGEVYWGHRNLFGSGESIRLTAETAGYLERALGRTDYGVRADFRKPDFLVRRQDLLLEAGLLRAHPEAYEISELRFGGGLERRFSPILTGSAMLRFSAAEVTDADGRETLYLLSMPLDARLDTTDSLLNPTEGYRARLTVTPSQVTGDRQQSVLSARLAGATYWDVTGSGRSVLAVRAAAGGMYTNDGRLPPAMLRFYSGGGGSVRGYDFQSLGPRDGRGRARGGRSLFEAGIELRQHITETIGLVPFVDAGTVFDRGFPDFSEDLRLGAGIGLRYYTGFGPLRLDVAVPLDRRDGERGFAVYLSLGQAF